MMYVNPGWFLGTAISTVFVILYPLVLAIIANRRLKVSWRYFGYGALIFFLFQLISRIPLVLWIQSVIAPQLRASTSLRLIWIIILALTAGIFEEIGRYIGYRWLMAREEKTWSKGVMYGIGHGGLESMLFVGGQLLLALINVATISIMGLNMLPASQRVLAAQQLAALNAVPAWTTLLAAWERLWTLPFHIAMSVVVLQVFVRRQFFWLWLAIALHALVDFTAAALPGWLGGGLTTSLIIEGLIAVVGLLSIWLIWVLRDRESTAATGETPSGDIASEDQ